MSKIIVLSGGFDPLHEGHISMFHAAAEKYDEVIVGLNSQEWLERKKGKAFMSDQTRAAVLNAIGCIDSVRFFDDSDDSCIELLREVRSEIDLDNSILYFGNGGDRAHGNFAEKPYCLQNSIEIDDGLGGTSKQNSSSDIIQNWSIGKAERNWGHWIVAKSYPGCKIKELVVNPGCTLSWQKHNHRTEEWFIRHGTGAVWTSIEGNDPTYVCKETKLPLNTTFHIPKGTWHQLGNPGSVPLSVIEIQHGSQCEEDDILRGTRPLNVIW